MSYKEIKQIWPSSHVAILVWSYFEGETDCIFTGKLSDIMRFVCPPSSYLRCPVWVCLRCRGCRSALWQRGRPDRRRRRRPGLAACFVLTQQSSVNTWQRLEWGERLLTSPLLSADVTGRSVRSEMVAVQALLTNCLQLLQRETWLQHSPAGRLGGGEYAKKAAGGLREGGREGGWTGVRLDCTPWLWLT